MKPFDIELAKQGKPVCLKNGKKARIICFDMKGDVYSIIALIDNGESESTAYYTKEGKPYVRPDDYSLMMASEKKTGWINIYPYQCEEKIAMSGDYVYKTQKDAKKYVDGDWIATVPIEWEE